MATQLTIVSESPGGLDMDDPAVTGITAGNAIAKYAVWLGLEGKSSTTITARIGALHRCAATLAITAGTEDTALADADAAHLLPWRLTLQGKADTYTLAQVSHVRSFYRWLADQGYRAGNPALRLPVPRKPESLPHPIGAAEFLDVLESAPPRIRLMIVLAAFCGLRAKEIALLRRSCVREKGESPHLLVKADATKGHRERRVPLHEFVVAEIQLAGLPVTGWCFPRLDGVPGPVSPHRVSALCNGLIHGCGYSETLHSLRHFAATELLRATGNLRIVQDFLGHRRADTTAIYTLVDNAELADGVAKMRAPRRLRAARGVAAIAVAAMVTAAAAPALSPAAPRSHVHRRPGISRAA